jgi:fermentation-respiration switch protein FrsA (DUF1100 family)
MTTFSVFDYLGDFLTQPLLLIAGSKADTKFFSEQAYEIAKGKKELFIIDGATHIALYDVPEYVEQAVTKMVSFFKVL